MIFPETIYSLDAEESADSIVDYIDNMLLDGIFHEVDVFFTTVDLSRLTGAAIVSALGITLAAKRKLNSRVEFFERALEEVTKRRGVAGANKLLNKYR